MPSKRRKNGEGSWGIKKIKGVEYKYFKKTYNGEDKYFYGKTEKEVKEKIKTFEESNKVIITKDIKKQTFGDYILTWLANVKQPSIKRRTYDSYEDIVTAQIINYNGFDIANKQMGTLDEDLFQKYYNEMAKEYSRATLKKNYAIVKQCLDYAVEHNHVKDNFANKITIPTEDLVAVKKKEIGFLEAEDMEKLYQESKRLNTEGFNFGGKLGELVYGINAYAITFIMYTGLRIGELIGLQWGDIDFKNKYITVKRSISTIKNRDKKHENDNKYVKVPTSVKTYSGYRTIPLSKRAIEVLNILKENNNNYKPDDYVFINQHGNILGRANVTRTLHAMLKRANCDVKECGLHALRHTFGSYLLLNKIDIKVVSKLLGHKDIRLTYNVYIHLINQQIIEAANVFDNIDNKDETSQE